MNGQDCLSCHVAGYRDDTIIFCDICVKKILEDMQRRKKAQEGDTDNE